MLGPILTAAMAATPAPSRVLVPELRWLMPGVAHPMRYECSEVISRIRALGALPPAPAEAQASAESILALGGDHVRVAAALVLLGSGAADEAHNLITPLSWQYGTTFGGPAVANSPAQREATYAHALVHRLEAHHLGEYGTGFHNSDFWFRYLASESMGESGEHELFPRVRDAALSALESTCSATREHRLIKRWADESLLQRAEGGLSWAPIAFNGLLAQATSTPDDLLRAFCEVVAVAELEALLELCLARSNAVAVRGTGAGEQAGGDVAGGRGGSMQPRASRGVRMAATTESELLGLTAAKAVSDAHAQVYAGGGAVVVRGAAAGTEEERVLAAAALAARLLDVPSVWARAVGLAGAGGAGTAVEECVVLLCSAAAAEEGDGVEVPHLPGAEGCRLASADALVVDGRVCAARLQAVVPTGLRTVRFSNSAAPGREGEEPSWTDPLYGKRGVSPTTVVQNPLSSDLRLPHSR
ncbi:hypothetical protein T492DRAFT_1142054 [Pavlovales sp. CCMP2436]|nr:hypothetical protein T492DRAFT_1142054 [Pavlovales sp. CCMP2436]